MGGVGMVMRACNLDKSYLNDYLVAPTNLTKHLPPASPGFILFSSELVKEFYQERLSL